MAADAGIDRAVVHAGAAAGCTAASAATARRHRPANAIIDQHQMHFARAVLFGASAVLIAPHGAGR